ncbi:Dabb family protein [uncultured Winogradskyella sp.]|uniref:Dabb family protein n=1 Tax=uncultured Winogradskyella sp. TaxID=395353 RepID=UPI002611E4A4|nr:Dabb family protein [uncultured Winogradskyella sp.]
MLLLFIGCKDAKIKNATTQTIAIDTPKSLALNGQFAHTVYFWLHEPTNEDQRTAFLKSLRNFINASEHVVTQHIGVPASTDRDVIDNTYTFSLLLTFKNAEDQEAYQNDPKHLQFINESQHLWSKVLVYDSELLN